MKTLAVLAILLLAVSLACMATASPAGLPVTAEEERAATLQAIPVPVPHYSATVRVEEGLHIRLEPEGLVLDVLADGTSVTVYKSVTVNDTEWCYVRAPKGWGWVACRYLEE